MRSLGEVFVWSIIITIISIVATHSYFRVFVPPEHYALLGLHPLIVAMIIGFALGWFGCWQIMVGQNHHIRLREMTDFDGLTGVFTRSRFFADIQQVDLERAAVIMVDVDFFKSVNDTCGHQCGDAVLVGITRLLRSGCRRDDLVGRYGGEEFVICLPETDAKEAEVLAERLRRTIELSAVDFEGTVLSVTISLGLAIGRPGNSIDELIARADAALLAAKIRGRNRVVTEFDMVPLPGGKALEHRRVRSASH